MPPPVTVPDFGGVLMTPAWLLVLVDVWHDKRLIAFDFVFGMHL
jgi:hypothetical protein